MLGRLPGSDSCRERILGRWLLPSSQVECLFKLVKLLLQLLVLLEDLRIQGALLRLKQLYVFQIDHDGAFPRATPIRGRTVDRSYKWYFSRGHVT